MKQADKQIDNKGANKQADKKMYDDYDMCEGVVSWDLLFSA